MLSIGEITHALRQLAEASQRLADAKEGHGSHGDVARVHRELADELERGDAPRPPKTEGKSHAGGKHTSGVVREHFA
jgi:hypothetical protein